MYRQYETFHYSTGTRNTDKIAENTGGYDQSKRLLYITETGFILYIYNKIAENTGH